MKHCPECNRNYADPTLSFCLEDGSPLIFGSAVEGPAPSDPPSEAPTRQIDPHTTAPTESFRIPDRARNESRSRRKLIWLIGGIAVVAAIAGFTAYHFVDTSSSNQIESVAVLPFENNSGDPNLDYLSDGLSESLIDKLSKLPRLKVISRNSSFKYRGAGLDLKDAAAKLGVRAIVTGTVSRIGDDLNVRVEMIDAREDRQVWSDQYQAKVADIISIQRQIAQEASQNLRAKLTGDDQQRFSRPDTTNTQAYESLAKARFFYSKGGWENRSKAIDLYLQAISSDPSYALAYAELADLYAISANSGSLDPKEAVPKAEAAAQTAVQLNPDLSEAHAALGYIRMNAWDWEAARREFLQAIELNPNSTRAHDLYSGYLSDNGRHDEAIAESKRAVELNPLSLVSQMGLAGTLVAAGKPDEAIEVLNKAKQLDPNYPSAYTNLGYAYAAKNMHKDAVAAFREGMRIGGESTSTNIYIGASLARLGDWSGALATLKKVEGSKEYVSPGELAILFTALGDREKALTTLERAYQEHDLQLKYLNVETGYDDLRSEPRFKELIRKVGLPES
ncbi:MAG TPA: tetratricopeptide repeat protein [Pyrinomonadaceae bacterium]|nr:tetratricopeptide repeat protein [Pyrinomonadaceae bacterium]